MLQLCDPRVFGHVKLVKPDAKEGRVIELSDPCTERDGYEVPAHFIDQARGDERFGCARATGERHVSRVRSPSGQLESQEQPLWNRPRGPDAGRGGLGGAQGGLEQMEPHNLPPTSVTERG